MLNNVTTTYTYDVSDPEAYGSQGNRLMSSVTTDAVQIVEERWYAYDDRGNVEQVIRRIAGDEDPFGEQWYRGTQLYYAKNGQLWLARSDRWQFNASGEPINCEALAAVEYRYNGARARYLVRPREPASMVPYAADDGDWHDYDGDAIYGDLTVAFAGGTVTATDVMAHEPGLAQYDHGLAALHHLHGNLIGTTERMTDDIASIARRAVYTAFGEPVWSDGTVGTRYGYAGSWGYQAPDDVADPLAELGWLHVGYRHYDPSTGRFVQRDPIGIRGGLNVYVYVMNNPLVFVDPTGEKSLAGKAVSGGVGGAIVYWTFTTICVFFSWTPPGAIGVGLATAGGVIGVEVYDDPSKIDNAIDG